MRSDVLDSIDVDRFWRRGFAIVRNAYTADEIAAFRRAVDATDAPKTDLLSNPHLRSVLTDGRLITVAQRLLNAPTIVYSGDSSFTVGRRQIGWHKDNADRDDAQAPDWQGRYTILRFGLYLQDHRWHTGGLNLRAASHMTTDLSAGRCRYVRSGLGDLVVWSLRTTHSGNGMLLRMPWGVHPPPHRQRSIPGWAAAPSPAGGRMALFAALGLDDAHHRRYAEYLRTRTYMVDIWRNSRYDDEAKRAAADAGLEVWDMPLSIDGDPDAGAAVDWAPLPY
ncbi:MAG: hypothetical protein AAFY28_10545 [Actinomycetota bacterium]